MSQSSKILQQSAAAFKMSAAAKMGRVWWISLALLTIGSLLLLVSQNARATALANPLGDFASAQSQQHLGDYNNLENLISDLLDDAGHRLKKSKLSSMRQIKQTLRFGRRSDPLMAPTFGERLELNENANDQHRMLALEED